MDQQTHPEPVETRSEPKIGLDNPARFINRELSWLDFNFRVVGEARNPRHPLLERLRFVSISASNLDEFYSVRVAGLIGQARAGVLEHSADGLTPAQQLHAINARARELITAQQTAFDEVRALLAKAGLVVLSSAELTTDDASFLDSYFMERVFPVLTPLAVDPAHPFPFIPNMGLVMALSLARDDDRGQMSALIPLPSQIERFIRLPTAEGPIRFIMLEELVAMNMSRLFPGFSVQGSGLFRLIRDTDVEFEEEAEDLVRSYESALKRRRRGVAIQLTIQADMPADLRELVIDAVEAPAEEIYVRIRHYRAGGCEAAHRR